MSPYRLLLALPLLAVVAPPRAAEPRPEGTLEAGEARAEVLSKPLPVGKRIELPEGWFQVEEEGTEDRNVGSFTIAEARPAPEADATPAPAAAPTARATSGSGPGVLPAAPTAAAACRPERNAYLRQVWKEAGIDVEDPEALIAGLDAGTSGPGTAYYWFALQVDPFRNLAFSSDLRDRARDLQRCMRRGSDG